MGKKRPDKTPAKPIEMDPDKLAVLLLRYAFRHAAKVGWVAKDRAIARGEGIEDIVQDALFSLYGGEADRKWDPEKHPDPMDHLRFFVNSRLSDLPRLYEFRHGRNAVDPDRHADPETPESLAIMNQTARAKAAWHERTEGLLQAEILNDDLLVRMHDLMEKEEIDKPSELADRLGVSVEEVKNAKKRIARAWVRVIAVVDVDPSIEKEARYG